jgi:hypothetical protein
MSQPVGEHVQTWTERRVVLRSVRQARAAEAALRARIAKAMAQIEALNQRGRGKKRFETVAALRQAVGAIVQAHHVENLVWFRVTQQTTPPPVRADRGQPARVDHPRHATVEGCVDEAALAAAVHRWGGASMRRINRESRCHWCKRYWPIAMNIQWSGVWGA